MKKTLILGATGFLGQKIAQELKKQNKSLILHYHQNKEKLGQIQKKESSSFLSDIIPGDFSHSDGIDLFLTELQKYQKEINSIIFCTGTILKNSLLQTQPSEFSYLFHQEVIAFFKIIIALKEVLKVNCATVINFGVCGMHTRRVFMCAPYAVVKRSLWDMTQSFAKEFASGSVRFNMISPGYIQGSSWCKEDEDTLPMARQVKIEEVLDLLLFLVSEKASYITGQNIEISGGLGL